VRDTLLALAKLGVDPLRTINAIAVLVNAADLREQHAVGCAGARVHVDATRSTGWAPRPTHSTTSDRVRPLLAAMNTCLGSRLATRTNKLNGLRLELSGK
jgi:hypothetical protein